MQEPSVVGEEIKRKAEDPQDSDLEIVGRLVFEVTFKQALNYATSEFVKVMYTTTSKSGAVNASDWQEASVDTWPAGNSWTFVTSNATLPAGTVRVAFRYTSTSSKAATWEIETVSIK